MAARSTGSGVLTLGRVTIPFRTFTAVSSERLALNQLHAPPCGSRLSQQLLCKAENKVVERSEIVHGYEHATDQFVTFTGAEMEALESEQADVLALEHFVPRAELDARYVAKTLYLGPDKGGARAFALLARTLIETGLLGIGTMVQRGKDAVVALAGRKEGDAAGLVLHSLWFAADVRPYEPKAFGADGHFDFSAVELGLARQLFAQRTSPAGFDVSRFVDCFGRRMREAIEIKVAGGDVVIAPAVVPPPPSDLLDALRASVGAEGEPRKAKPRARGQAGARAR